MANPARHLVARQRSAVDALRMAMRAELQRECKRMQHHERCATWRATSEFWAMPVRGMALPPARVRQRVAAVGLRRAAS